MSQSYAPYSQSQSRSRSKPKIEQNYHHANHYDNPQADIPSTDVTAHSPSLPSAPHSHYPAYAPPARPENTYAPQTHYRYPPPVSQIPDGGHVTNSYVPNPAASFPHSVSITSPHCTIAGIQPATRLECPPGCSVVWQHSPGSELGPSGCPTDGLCPSPTDDLCPSPSGRIRSATRGC